jgi:hypothetical protein
MQQIVSTSLSLSYSFLAPIDTWCRVHLCLYVIYPYVILVVLTRGASDLTPKQSLLPRRINCILPELHVAYGLVTDFKPPPKSIDCASTP